MNRVLAVTVLAVLCTATPALAGTPGTWTRFTGAKGSNIDEIGLARTLDNVLHVVYESQGAIDPTHPDIFQRPIGVDGTVGAGVAVQSNWASLSSPDLVTTPDGGGLAAFFGGIRSTDPGETHQEMNLATSPDGGATWSLAPSSVVAPGAAYAAPAAATRLGDVYWEGWGGTGAGAFVHRGISASTPNVSLQDRIGGGCCGYDVNLATDTSTNTVLAAWYSNATANQGVFAQVFDAAGTPVGSPTLMPGSTTLYQGNTESSSGLERVPLVAVPGRHFALAYPSGYPSSKNIVVWVPPSATSTKIATVNGNVAGVGLAAGADGRLWVAWSQSTTLFARRSNAAGTAWGAIVHIGPPKNTASIWKVDADVNPGGPLDLFVNLDSPNSTAFWHTQVLPGLSLAASPGTLHRKAKTKVTFVAADAGDPLAGVTVKVGSVSGTTASDGKVTLKLGPFAKKTKSVGVTGKLAGYTTAHRTLKVKK
jgi:hypothetical protein